MNMLKAVCPIFLLLACMMAASLASPSCLDMNGNAVDWWVVLKAPKLKGTPYDSAEAGFAYAYGDSNEASLSLTSHGLDQADGALGATLGQIYGSSSSSLAYAMYNDQSPDGSKHSTYAHSKGVVAFSSSQGFWLLHSTPRFPQDPTAGGYGFPSDEATYGQSFLCVTYSTSTINTLAGMWLLNKPAVYSSNLPSSMASSVPNVQALLNKEWIREAEFMHHNVTSVGGQMFVTFATSDLWDKNLWEDAVASTLQSGLLVESWMNGSESNKMPSYCTPNHPYDCIDVRNVTVPGSQGSLSWGETQDHSKWASVMDRPGWFCIGDKNRQFSQAGRGGGAACTQHVSMGKDFAAIISGADQC